MTNTARRRSHRAICFQCKIQLNSSNHTSDTSHVNPMCNRCYDMAGYENEHQDGYHDDEPHPFCPMCDESLLKDRSRKGHVGTTVAKGSHAECYAAKAHAATKAGRAACRAKKAAN